MNQELIALLSQVTEEEQHILEGHKNIEKERYSSGKGFIIDRNKMLRRGETIALRTHTRFVDFPSHRHNYIEVMYVCQGSIIHCIDGEEVVLQQGELLFLNQYASHSIKAAGSGDIGVNLFILPEFFDSAFGMLERDSILMDFMIGFLRQSGGTGRYLLFRVAEVQEVQNLVENLVLSLAYKRRDETQINQMLLGALFLYLQKYTGLVHENTPVRYNNSLVLAALRYIDEQYRTATLTELAEQLNQPLPLMSRLIKAETGQTFKELLQQRRLQAAETLLCGTDLPVSDIVTAIGYENNSYFYRCFREKKRMSPREYRLSYREN